MSLFTQDVGQRWSLENPPVDINTSHLEIFVHQPLDLHAATIRHVVILPLERDGIIRCNIRNVLMGAQWSNSPVGPNGTVSLPSDPASFRGIRPTRFICLSYVWGHATETRAIMLNGKSFEVRKNLWNFLLAAALTSALHLNTADDFDNDIQKDAWSRPLWIEALCIDQSNISEKNHQVKQMGRIYSAATNVVAWLGMDSSIATLFSAAEGASRGHKIDVTGDVFRSLHAFSLSSYWERAWITQELLLARGVYLLARTTIIPLQKLDILTKLLPAPALSKRLVHFWKQNVQHMLRPKTQWTLIDNVEIFQAKQCEDPRDRAYSLISVSRDGAALEVDYGCSARVLMQRILRLAGDGFCTRRAISVYQAMDLQESSSVREKRMTCLKIDRRSTLGHVYPCGSCGQAELQKDIHDSQPSQTVEGTYGIYICLSCEHRSLIMPEGVHQHSELGHLRLDHDTSREKDKPDWRVLWAPATFEYWQELEGWSKIYTDQHGEFRRLIISLELLEEVANLASIEQGLMEPRFKTKVWKEHGTTLWRLARRCVHPSDLHASQPSKVHTDDIE